jgi:hypothetical protein
MRASVLVLLSLSCLSCGGKLEGEGDPSLALQGKSSTEADRPDPVYPSEGPWGLWQLLAVGKNYDPPFIELDLHENGTAFMWRCAGDPNGIRCGSPFGCTTGTLTRSADDTWHVQLTDDHSNKQVARADLSDDPSGDIVVDGSGLLPAAGLYRRLGAATKIGCLP